MKNIICYILFLEFLIWYREKPAADFFLHYTSYRQPIAREVLTSN